MPVVQPRERTGPHRSHRRTQELFPGIHSASTLRTQRRGFRFPSVDMDPRIHHGPDWRASLSELNKEDGRVADPPRPPSPPHKVEAEPGSRSVDLMPDPGFPLETIRPGFLI